MTRIEHILSILVVCAAFCAALTSCHTTSRLADDEVLYTGVKHLKINVPDTVEVPSGVVDNIKSTINVPANNSLYSPYVRWPLPVGLWIYNHWQDDAKGLKGWIYRKFSEQPVLISDVRPDLRMKMVEEMLGRNGFFGSTASYELLYNKKNHRKARVDYFVNVAPPKRITELRLLPDSDSQLDSLVNTYARRDAAIRPGEVFCIDSLSIARTRITNRLRNQGYYYFRPEFLTFEADSTISDGIALRLVYSPDVVEAATRKYKFGNVSTLILRNDDTGHPDTIHTKSGDVVCMRPAKLRPDLIPSCITFKTGDVVKMRQITNTQAYLSRLGIFNSVALDLTPLDSVKSDTLNAQITCRFDKPLTTQLELNLSSKSNSYLGPGVSFAVAHRNMFGGAERLTIKADLAYEWQIGKIEQGKNRSDFNSYEFGLNAELAFPRLIAPKFLKTIRRELSWTRVNLGGDIMNRPHFFKMVQLNTGFGYEWMASRYSKNQFTPIDLRYNKLLSTTPQFDQTMAENKAIALSFQDQFIAKMAYTYTYDRTFGPRRQARRRLTLQASVVEGGNILSGIWEATGAGSDKRLFGLPFSQFVKAQVQAVYSHRIGTADNRLVGRLFLGAAHAYGNSKEVPYTEMFYVGGANSLRAFAVRSIGPGSYHSESSGSGYYDQTGTFRFEANLEWRFPIISMLKGAVFVDAGNIWLLSDDPQRPGAKLSSDFFRDLALCSGVGLRFDMGMIVVRGDLGVGLHLPYQTSKSGYYNLESFRKSLAFNLAIGYPF
ncbi:MAG: BamA/TamA family outer membrane protein [Candidatus Limisoma sp.]